MFLERILSHQFFYFVVVVFENGNKYSLRSSLPSSLFLKFSIDKTRFGGVPFEHLKPSLDFTNQGC
jgi:hypothetical protein